MDMDQRPTNTPRLFPIPEGTRWPSGKCEILAVLPLDGIQLPQLAERLGSPLARGFEPGLGEWTAIGGGLSSGAMIEIICYKDMPKTAHLHADSRGDHSAVVMETLELVGLSKSDVRISPLAGG